MTKVVFVQPFEVNERLARELEGRVVVLDVAFCADTPRASFATTTLPFISTLGGRLVLWLDHHEHERHADFRNDPRFVLVSRKEHPATPEMITPELVQKAGHVDTIVAHGDFDGIMAVAKWLLCGEEPYEGADMDARAADSRLRKLSPIGEMIDNALKYDLTDDNFRQTVLKFLTSRCTDEVAREEIERRARLYEEVKTATDESASRYTVMGKVAFVDITNETRRVDLTRLLIEGQKRAPVAAVRHRSLKNPQEISITCAAPTNSDINLLKIFGLSGGMPTRVTLPDTDINEVVRKINEAI